MAKQDLHEINACNTEVDAKFIKADSEVKHLRVAQGA